MGMSTGNTTSGMSHEPNVVPMIDIMLVLLIIFMIMQPLNRKALDLQLPDPTPAEAQPQQQTQQIVLEVLPDNQFAVNKEAIPANRLQERLREIYDPRPDKIIFVKGDPSVTYQSVVWAIDQARGAGVAVVGIAPKETD